MDEHEQKIKIGGILQNRDLAQIGIMSIPDRPGVAGAVLSALGTAGISCAFIAHTIDLDNLDNIMVCVERRHLTAALRVLNKIKETVGAQRVVYDGQVAMISLHGPHFAQRPGIAGVMFSALAAANINILAISTSISSVSCIIDATRIDDAAQTLEEAFELP